MPDPSWDCTALGARSRPFQRPPCLRGKLDLKTGAAAGDTECELLEQRGGAPGDICPCVGPLHPWATRGWERRGEGRDDEEKAEQGECLSPGMR